MNLKQKKLMGFPVGTAITVHYSAGTFSGIISDRDDEYLEISYGKDSICLRYEDVEMYVCGNVQNTLPQKNTLPPQKKTEPSPRYSSPSAAAAPTSVKKTAYIPVFMTDIQQPLFSDGVIKAALKRTKPISKSVFIDKYNSLTNAMKNADKTKAALVLKMMINDIREDASASADPVVWETASLLSMRLGEMEPEYALRAGCYENAARYYTQKEEYSFAGLFAALSICSGRLTDSPDEMYSVALVSCKKADDLGGISRILKTNRYPDYDRQLLKAVCSYKGIEYSDRSNILFKLDELSDSFKNHDIVDKFEELSALLNVKPMQEKPVDAPAAETAEQNDLKGQIVRLSWSKDEGTLEYGSDGKKSIVFCYSDLSEDDFREEISTIYTADVTDKDFYVAFDIRNGRAVNLRRDAAGSIRKDTKEKAKHEKYINLDFTDKMSLSDILKRGRAYIANAYDPDRFYKAYALWSKTLAERGIDKDLLSEFYNCCLALNNASSDETQGRMYIDEGLSYFRKAVSVVKPDLKYDISSMNILRSFGTFTEITTVLERLIAYPTVRAPQRLYFVTGLADVCFKHASETGKAEDYQNAADKYALWERVFCSDAAVFSSPVNNQAYYSKILVNYAKCLILAGKRDAAEPMISKVRANAPDAFAVSGLEELVAERAPVTAKRDDDTLMTAPEAADNDGAAETDISDETVCSDETYSETDTAEADDEEELLCPYSDVDNMERLGLTADNIMKYVFSLRSECAHVYSLAYLNAAAVFDKKIAAFRDVLSIALDEPFHEHGYNASEIIEAFNVRDEQYGSFFEYCFAAAALRSLFSKGGKDDYFADSLCDMISLSSDYPELKALSELLLAFRKKHGAGMDVFAPYRLIDKNEGELRLNQLLSRARDMYSQNFETIFRETVNQLRFRLTKAYIYSRNEKLEELFRHVKDNDREYFLANREDFEKTFIRQGCSASRNNVSDEKIDAFIDYYWAKAGESDKIYERKSSELMGSLRNHLKVRIREIVSLVCDWAELSDSLAGIKEDTDGNADFIKHSPEAAELIGRILGSLDAADADDETAFSRNILSVTLKELRDKLTGEWSPLSRKYFYADFLTSDRILLDKDFRPELESTFCSLDDFNIFTRLREHFEDTEKSVEQSYERIFSRDSVCHNFGTAALIEEYISETAADSQLSFRDSADFENAAENMLKSSYVRFVEDIQLANGKGQIMLYDDFMNTVNDTAYYWYKYCLRTKNYGFFFSFIESVKRKITSEAASYAELLEGRLNEMLRRSPELFRDEDVSEQLLQQIKEHNFLVAEDWMNRLSRNDFYDSCTADDDNFDALEALRGFLAEYDKNFESSKDSGLNLSSQVRRGGYIPAKDKKGGLALISSWLSNGNRSTPTKIKTILNGLGWDDIEVTDQSSSTQELYKVKLTGSFAGNKIFQHPFAAFGTASQFSGFYTACLYGYYNADRIIDKYKALDSIPGNKIVLLDFALSAAERRTLARKTKETRLANTYILVDRVALLYIANNFTSGSNNRTLMAITLPFAYAQPYVAESSQDMPPEMFIGRKEELLSIEAPDGASLLFGGRQLGKSALLKKARKDVEDPANARRAVFLDLKGIDYKNAAKKISCELVDLGILPANSETEDWDELERRILVRLRDTENPIVYLLLLLDEADELIRSSEGLDYLPIVKLKNIQQRAEGRFKFVLAGLHNMVRFNRKVALGNNSVIPHIPYINITPFDYRDAKQLLCKPLGYLGFSFENNDVIISQILAATNYFPGLIQLYCKKLIEAMKNGYAGYNESDTPVYRVSETHIKKVLSDTHFREQIKEKFDDTLFLDADDGGYYYSTALLIALITDGSDKSSCLASEISEEAKKHGLAALAALETDTLEAILDELCCLNILMKDADGAYSFSTKNFRDMMGSAESVEEQLLELIGRGDA